MTDQLNNTSPPDPFGNLAALRLGQSFADTVGVKKLLTTVPVRKPGRQDFTRVPAANLILLGSRSRIGR